MEVGKVNVRCYLASPRAYTTQVPLGASSREISRGHSSNGGSVPGGLTDRTKGIKKKERKYLFKIFFKNFHSVHALYFAIC